MAVDRICASCGKVIRVPDILAKQVVKCPDCGSLTGGEGQVATTEPRPASPLSSNGAPANTQPEIPTVPVIDSGADPHEETRRDVEPHRGRVILALGIISLVLLALGGCAVLGIPVGIVAWVMGTRDLKRIRAGTMDPEGENMTNAGRICGMIGVIIDSLMFVGLVMIYGVIFGYLYSSSVQVVPSGKITPAAPMKIEVREESKPVTKLPEKQPGEPEKQDVTNQPAPTPAPKK